MPSVALVSGCDSNYYPILREWLHSVQRFPESKALDICVIDAGLTPGQVSELTQAGVKKIVRPDWPCKLPESRIKGKEWLKACVCRPFIPKIFPGYDAYMWMDSDTWVQNWRGVQTFIDGALEKKDRLIITNECNRHRSRQTRIKWLWRWPYKVKNFYSNNCVEAFGFSVAKELLSKFVMSAGCFAMSADAPHWKRWQELIIPAMTKGKIFTAEQTSLGVLVYHEGYKAEMLPVYLHWHCDVQPMWDDKTRQFIEPFIPHEPIGVIHMSGVDDMRSDRAATAQYETREGSVIRLNCRYPHFDGGSVSKPKRA